MKVKVIGDVHGKIERYAALLNTLPDEYDYTVQVGDLGFAQHYEAAEQMVRQGLGERHFFFGGNHDEYPNLPSWHLGDYGTLPFSENGFFVRGARSIDRKHRTAGLDWWPEEELSPYKHEEVVEAYRDAEPDLMLTHEAPAVAVKDMFPNKTVFETATGQLMNKLFMAHKPEAWIFGHWHHTTSTTLDGTEFACLDELDTIDIEL